MIGTGPWVRRRRLSATQRHFWVCVGCWVTRSQMSPYTSESWLEAIIPCLRLPSKYLIPFRFPVLIFRHNRNLLYNGKNNMQAWGLIVLLVSKAAGHTPSIPDMEQDKSAGVLHSQRALAEVTEMIRISHMVHQGLVNLQPITQAGNDKASHSDMTFGNKIALLSGDYLLGNSCAELAGLR